MHETQKIQFIRGREIFQAYPSEIIRMEARSNYTYVHFTNKAPVLMAKVLRCYEEMLRPFGFLRTHRSHLVNAAYVINLESDHRLLMRDASCAEISRRRKREVSRIIHQKSHSKSIAMKNIVVLFLSLCTFQFAFTQSVGVGTNTPDASAILDVSSTTQGMLVPRMTSAERTAVTNPATGLLVFDTNTNSFWFKGGTTWIELVDSANTTVHTMGNNIYMGMTGNVGIGTMEPTSKLEVKTATDSPGIKLSDASKSLTATIEVSKASVGTTTNHPLHLFANSQSNQVTLSPLGDVGIGTDAPASKLEVATNTDANGIKLTDGLDVLLMRMKSAAAEISTTTNKALHLNANGGTNQLTISPLGNIGIGKVGLKKLDVEGEAHISQKLGIGTLTANAPLQLANTVANRKIVLWENGNNDHQYFGFGINSSMLRYQTQGDHAFFNGVNATSSIELMRVTSNGRVGVGVSSPLASMDIIRGTAPNGTLAVRGTTHQSQFSVGADEHTYIRGGKNGSHVVINDDTNLGNVAIGLPAPQNKVDVHSGPARTGTHATNRPMYVTGTLPETTGGIEFRNADATQGIGFGSNTVYAAGSNASQDLRIAAKGSTGKLMFRSNDIDHMFIDPTGKVGIGVTAPGATLEIERGTAPFGTMQINGTTHDSHFNYGTPEDTYIRGGKEGAKVIINELGGLGNVGIGTDNPAQKLHVAGNATISEKLGIGTTNANASLQFSNDLGNRKVVLYEGANNDHQYYGLGVNGSTLRYQVSATGDNHVFYAGVDAGTSNELMRIKGNGNVGIGTSTPNAALQFSNANANRKIVLYEAQNNDHEFNGFGAANDHMRYQTWHYEADHIFYSANTQSSSNQLMRISGLGNVSIGVPNTSEKLEVGGNAKVTGELKIGYQVVSSSLVIVGPSTQTHTCDCPGDLKAIGGGWYGANSLATIGSYPTPDGSGWSATSVNSVPLLELTLTVYAVCARLAN